MRHKRESITVILGVFISIILFYTVKMQGAESIKKVFDQPLVREPVTQAYERSITISKSLIRIFRNDKHKKWGQMQHYNNLLDDCRAWS